jgi:hypothetical protein
VTSGGCSFVLDVAVVKLERANRTPPCGANRGEGAQAAAVRRTPSPCPGPCRRALAATLQEQQRLAAFAETGRRAHGVRASPIVPVSPPAPPGDDPETIDLAGECLKAMNVEAARPARLRSTDAQLTGRRPQDVRRSAG